MADQPLAEMVELAVREFTSEPDASTEQGSQTAEHDNSNPTGKRRKVEATRQECEEAEGVDSIQSLLYSASKTLCLRLDAIEANLNSVEDKCKCLRAKVDMLANQNALRPPLAEHGGPEGQRQGICSSTALPKKPRPSPGDPTEEQPATREAGGGREQGEPGEGQAPGIQGLGPGLRIVALCADDGGGAEERPDGGVALLPDATNLLYQLMY